MPKRATVDQDACISCELCTELCPEVFFMNDDGKAEARDADCQEHDLEEVAPQCPVDAISVRDV